MLGKDTLFFKHPVLNVARSSEGRFRIAAVCAVPALAQSAITDGGASLVVAGGALAGALAAAIGAEALRGRPGLRDSGCLATALILALMLPDNINPVFPALGAFFAVAVIRECFGGAGTNWFNPALGGWLLLRVSFPGVFREALQNSPLVFLSDWGAGVSGGAGLNQSPVAILNSNGFGAQNGDTLTSFLNRNVFSFLNIELPGNYFDFFVNPGPGIIADRGAYGLLAGGILLAATGTGRSFLAVVFMAVFVTLARFGGALLYGGTFWQGDMIFSLLSGGTLAAAFFLVAESSSSPKSAFGRLVYIVPAAALSYYFRFAAGEDYGAFLAVAVLNTVNPVIRILEERFLRGRLSGKRARLSGGNAGFPGGNAGLSCGNIGFSGRE